MGKDGKYEPLDIVRDAIRALFGQCQRLRRPEERQSCTRTYAEIQHFRITRGSNDPLNDLRPVMTAEEILELQQSVADVSVDDALIEYLMRIVAATRDSEMLDLGVSPRGTLSLFRAAQALALTEERAYCIPDDIKRLVLPVFAHRILVSTRYASSMRRSEEAEAVLTEIMKTVSVPL